MIPTLRLRLFDDRLEVECNEIGFTRSQVESLCRIGASTKAKDTNGAIGEKGIGFKSVFKVSSIAKIQSGPYSFQFDTNPPLLDHGMIVPSWVEQQPTSSGTKGFVGSLLTLTFKDSTSILSLFYELTNLDLGFLLFLHKIRRLEVSFHVGSNLTKEVIHEANHDQEGEKPRILVRTDCDNTTTLAELDFVLFRHLVLGMPEEEKRQGVSVSEAILAFPLKGGNPEIQKRQTYAFLPIGHYGFKVSSCAVQRRLEYF